MINLPLASVRSGEILPLKYFTGLKVVNSLLVFDINNPCIDLGWLGIYERHGPIEPPQDLFRSFIGLLKHGTSIEVE